MGIPVIFLSFVVFVVLYRIQLAKLDRPTYQANDRFWEREEASLFVRKKEIKAHEFIITNPEVLPTYSEDEYASMGDFDLFEVQQKCIRYSNYKMLNTSHLLNSEVRLKYGSSNINIVEEYEDNYNRYILTLSKLGKGLFELNKYEDAIRVLEEGIHVKTDISDHIILLGSLYAYTNQRDNFSNLYEYTHSLNSILKNKIIKALDAIE